MRGWGVESGPLFTGESHSAMNGIIGCSTTLEGTREESVCSDGHAFVLTVEKQYERFLESDLKRRVDDTNCMDGSIDLSSSIYLRRLGSSWASLFNHSSCCVASPPALAWTAHAALRPFQEIMQLPQSHTIFPRAFQSLMRRCWFVFPRNLGPLLKFLISEPSHKFQRRKGLVKVEAHLQSWKLGLLWWSSPIYQLGVFVTQDKLSVLVQPQPLLPATSLCSGPPQTPSKSSPPSVGLFLCFPHSSLMGGLCFLNPPWILGHWILCTCCSLSLEPPSRSVLLGVAFPGPCTHREAWAPLLCASTMWVSRPVTV